MRASEAFFLSVQLALSSGFSPMKQYVVIRGKITFWIEMQLLGEKVKSKMLYFSDEMFRLCKVKVGEILSCVIILLLFCQNQAQIELRGFLASGCRHTCFVYDRLCIPIHQHTGSKVYCYC